MKSNSERFGISRGGHWMVTGAILLACGVIFSSTAQASCKPLASRGLGFVSAGARPVQPPRTMLQPPQDQTEEDDAPIVGLWHAHFLSGGQVFDDGFDQWHSDGTEILNDTAPPQPANGAGTVCLGVYRKIGPRSYKLKHPFWSFDANGNLAGSGVFLESVTVSADGNTYSGSFTFIAYDLDGNVIAELKGDIKAERITAD